MPRSTDSGISMLPMQSHTHTHTTTTTKEEVGMGMHARVIHACQHIARVSSRDRILHTRPEACR
jgi:hypothetical protein